LVTELTITHHCGAEDQPYELSAEQNMSKHEAIPPSGTESAAASAQNTQKMKQARKHTDLSDEDKEAIMEWLKLNPLIYNKRLPDFRDTEKKLGLWAELADRLGRTIDELTTFYDTTRTNMSRAKRMFKSGTSPDQFTVTLIWYWERFQFLLPHIYDVKARNVASFTATLGAASAATTTSDSNSNAVPSVSSYIVTSPDAEVVSDVEVGVPSVTPVVTAAANSGDRSVIGECP